MSFSRAPGTPSLCHREAQNGGASSRGRRQDYKPSWAQTCFYAAVQAGFAEWDVSRDRGSGASGTGYSRAGDEGTGNSRAMLHAPPEDARARGKLLDAPRLVQEWVAVYPTILRPKLNRSEISSAAAADGQRDWICGRTMHCGAGKWQPIVYCTTLNRKRRRSMRTTQRSASSRNTRLRADATGDVEILDVFWNTDQVPAVDDLVPPLLAYADLTGDHRRKKPRGGKDDL